MTPRDSARVKRAILASLSAEYPLEVEQGSRDFAQRFGLEYLPNGTLREGHMSRKILLGAALPIYRMSETDRRDVVSRFPASFDELYGSLYKRQNSVKWLATAEGKN